MTLKVGEVVVLKSGSPRMTVVGFGRDPDGKERVNCTWFDKNDNERNGTFPADTLEVYEDENESGEDDDDQ